MSGPVRLLTAFKPGKKGKLEGLHPATKLWMLLLLVAAPLFSRSLLYELSCLALAVPPSLLSGSGERIGGAIRGSYLLLGLIFILNYVFLRDLELSTSMTVRFLAMLVVSVTFLSSMDPAELGDLLGMLRFPKSLTFSFVIALRFIPVMADDIQTISAAQMSRGYRGDVGGPLERVRRAVPILMPAVISAVRRSQVLAEAMESRCFGSGVRRTSMVSYRFGLRDVGWSAYSVMPIILSLILP